MSDPCLELNFELNGRSLTGFCMRINDEFYETYAVILDGYHSFSVWLDASKRSWCASKYANVDSPVLDKVILALKGQSPAGV